MTQRAETLESGQPVLERLKELALREREDTGVFISVEHASPSVLKAFLDSLDLWRKMYAEQATAVQNRDTIGQLVELLVPDAPATSAQLRQAHMLAKAKRALLESGDWVTAHHLAELAELSAANPSSQPNKWKRAMAVSSPYVTAALIIFRCTVWMKRPAIGRCLCSKTSCLC